MDERTDSGGVIVVLGVLVILLSLMIAGGGFFYVLYMRRSAMVIAEARAAAEAQRYQAEMAAARARMEEAPADAPRKMDLEEGAANAEGNSAPAIAAMLDEQAQAWNAGDLERFMEHYWKSDDLTFSSGGETTRGWAATLARYRERYPTAEKMGRVSFDSLEITRLGPSAALVLGRWHVDRDAEPLQGNFSLVVRKLDGRWLIIHDHTSRK
jgi:beta-aspartyl-peptidase (threonine type)